MRLFFILVLICCQSLHAQNISSSKLEDIAEPAEGKLEESSESELPPELVEMSSRKIDVNTREIDFLVTADLLTPFQCQAIKDYITKNGRLIEVEELQQVTSMDKISILKILPYITVNSIKAIESRTTLTLRYQQSLLNQKNYFNGAPYRLLLRLKSDVSQKIQFGITGEKDEGEEIFSSQKPLFDFNSFYVLYRGKKNLRKIIAGDFNVEYGQGLNAWTGFSFGSASIVTSIYKTSRGIVPASGTDENRFLRGVGVMYEKNRTSIDSWISYHKIDANTTDLSGEKVATTFQYSGYHRSYSELSDFHSQAEFAAGLQLKYKINNGEIGLISSGQKYRLRFTGNDQPYGLYSLRGNANQNTGIFYNLHFKNIILFGEGSVCTNSTIAWLNGIIVSADSKFSFSILHRHYPQSFLNIKSDAIGVNSSNNNEDGTLFSLSYNITKQITYSAGADIYSFPFIKYKVNAPSAGKNYLQQVEYKPNKKTTVVVRFREKTKQQNASAESSNLISEFNFRSLRLSGSVKIDNSWTYAFRTEYVAAKNEIKHLHPASSMSHDLIYHPMGRRYSFGIRYAVFSCTEFESRIYAYENDVQGAFSIPFYYGKGVRYYINGNIRISNKINLAFRYSVTSQDDAEKYSAKSDIKIQLRLNL